MSITKEAIEAVLKGADVEVRKEDGARMVLVKAVAAEVQDNGVKYVRDDEFRMETSLAAAHEAAGVVAVVRKPPAAGHVKAEDRNPK